MLTLPWSRPSTRSSRCGNGQSGLVSAGTMRVSACTPTVRITQSVRIFGCAAKARVGLTSSQRSGAPGAALPSGIERHIVRPLLARRDLQRRSPRSLFDRLPICSLTVLSSSGFTSLETLSLMPATLMPPSASATWPDRLGSIRQFEQQRGLRGDRDVAADVGALVERARRQLLHLAAELAAEQAADRAGEVAARVGKLAGDAERAVQRGRDVQAGRRRRSPRSGRGRWSSRCRPCRADRRAGSRSCR